VCPQIQGTLIERIAATVSGLEGSLRVSMDRERALGEELALFQVRCLREERAGEREEKEMKVLLRGSSGGDLTSLPPSLPPSLSLPPRPDCLCPVGGGAQGSPVPVPDRA